jgi:oxygen-dependent protoporphyrinogen oxidase
MNSKTAIVIGGGPAGASAAFRLKQAGLQVCLVERDDRVGGRTRSERIDGFILDTAAGLLPGTYTAFYELMKDAGLRDALEPMVSPTAVARDGQLHYLDLSRGASEMLRTKLLGARAKVDLLKVGLKALSMWRTLGFDNLGLAAPHDTESIAAYARRSLSPELLEYLLNPVEKIMYTVNAEQASVVDFFWCAKCLLSPTAFCVKGGMDRIVTQVSEHFEVRNRTEATAVTERNGAVQVALRDADGVQSVMTADVCVIATPACEVPRIDQGLSEASRRYLGNLRYSVLNYLQLRLSRRPAEKAVLIMVPDSVDPDLCGILLDHNKGSDRVPAGKGALSVYFLDSWSRQAADWSDEQIVQQALSKVERVMPGVSAWVEGFYIKRWDWAATLSHPGCYREMADFTAQLDTRRRVQLAGDYFSMASVNTAVTSGRVAAERLLAGYR